MAPMPGSFATPALAAESSTRILLRSPLAAVVHINSFSTRICSSYCPLSYLPTDLLFEEIDQPPPASEKSSSNRTAAGGSGVGSSAVLVGSGNELTVGAAVCTGLLVTI